MNLTPPAEEPKGTRGIIARVRGTSTGLAVAALVSITLAFYHGLWLPGLVLLKRNAFAFHLPIKEYLIARLSEGDLPQWFPYEGLGRPFIGPAATGLFHPFTLLYFMEAVPDAYRLATLLSCLLAALGAFVLGRALQFSNAGALVAGIAYALSGYIVSLTENIHYLYSICVLPLFCAGLERSLRDGRWVRVVPPAIIWATVFLNGDVQTGYYYGFIALLWVIARAPGSRLNAWLKLTLIGVLATVLAGIQLGPAWGVFAESSRAQPPVFHEQAIGWGTHPLRLLTVLASPVGGHANPVAVTLTFFGVPRGDIVAESLYLGVPVIGLGLLGAWYRRDLRVLVLLGGLALLLSLGRWGGLYELFYHAIPFWSAFRYPEKLMGVVSFSVALLAGAGFDAVRTGKGAASLWLVTAVLCISAWLGLRSEATSAWVAATFSAPAELAREVTGSAALASLFSGVAALGVWTVVQGHRSRRLQDTLLIVFLAAILVLDLSRANLGAFHTGPAEMATFTPPLAEALHVREGTLAPGRFRLVALKESLLEARPPALDQLHALLGPYGTASVMVRQTLDVEHNAQFHIESAKGFLPGYSAAFTALVSQKPGIEAAARYNIAYYIGRRFYFRDPRFATAKVAELPDYDLVLIRNPAPVKPRVYLSHRPEFAAEPVTPATLLDRTDFLNGEVDVVEAPAETVQGLSPVRDGTATLAEYRPEEVRVRVETTQRAMLILLDAFDKGWTAQLETGENLPILRANALVRAVAVPAGVHTVTFSYQTPLLKAGAWTSLAGVLLCFWLGAPAQWRTNPMGRFRSDRKTRGA